MTHYPPWGAHNKYYLHLLGHLRECIPYRCAELHTNGGEYTNNDAAKHGIFNGREATFIVTQAGDEVTNCSHHTQHSPFLLPEATHVEQKELG